MFRYDIITGLNGNLPNGHLHPLYVSAEEIILAAAEAHDVAITLTFGTDYHATCGAEPVAVVTIFDDRVSAVSDLAEALRAVFDQVAVVLTRSAVKFELIERPNPLTRKDGE